MHRIDQDGAVIALPTPAAVGTPGYFQDGDPGLGVEATIVTADWLNAVQEEIAYVVEQAGLAMDKTARTQLKAAIEYFVKGGGSPQAVVFGDSPYTATSAKRILKVDTSGGAVQINLPAAAGVAGFEFTVVKVTADANAVTVDANGAELINDSLTQVLATQWTSLTFYSIGTGWVIK